MIDVISGTATIGSALAGGGFVETGTGTLVLDGTLAFPARRRWTEARSILSPLAAAAGGGRRPGDRPRRCLQRQRQSLYALDPAMFSLVQSLFVDQAIDRADMIQILESAVVDGAVTRPRCGALETLTMPQNEARLNMPDYVAVLAADVVQGNPANANYQGQPLGNLADQATRPVAGHGLGRPGGQVVLWHGPARH